MGTLLAHVVFCLFTWYHKRESQAGARWTKNEIYRRLPLACIAAPLYVSSSRDSQSFRADHRPRSMVIGLFWLGWTVWPSVSPVIPMISGVFFCCGYQLLFMGMVNYLTDVYRHHSASAHAAASMTRSIGAVLLPLAAGDMYDSLGLHWAPSVLGFIALAMGAIPFIFIRFGDRLARSSKYGREAFPAHA